MSRPRILLLDNHDSYTYNLYQLLWEISGTRPDVVGNDEATVEELLRERYTHVVISPGPGSPERPEDIGVGAGLVARIQVPCLGVCLGHQAIAVACGGLVAPAPAIRHGWVGDVRHRGRGLFEGIPRRFRAVRYHSLAVAAPLPDALRVTAWCDDGVIMAVEHRDRPLWGVQFHPESVLTEFGDRLVANFLGGPWTGEGPAAPQRRRPRSTSRTEPWTRPCTGRRTESQARVRGPLAGRGNDPGTVHWRLLPFGVRPETAFSRLFADQPYCFWLDGARQSDGMGRYSFMGAAGGEGWSVLRSWDGGRSAIVETPLGATSTGQSLLECLRCGLGPPVAAGDVPVPFVGGYVGYLGYGVKESLGIGKPEAVTGSEQDSGSPDAELLRVDRLVAFDHATGRVFLVASRVEAPSALAWFEEMTGRLAELPAEQPAQDPAAIPAV
ncbi:MAG: gamma-glutamyl-gamma-aminobutyrate hydrolase family protein, partial [Micromonosporaceae bacterium]|nr:gamma-glutamyl-gamma-aminobutyrate hydrolase family protein [Micromonosporaceae bacterium]